MCESHSTYPSNVHVATDASISTIAEAHDAKASAHEGIITALIMAYICLVAVVAHEGIITALIMAYICLVAVVAHEGIITALIMAYICLVAVVAT